MPKMCEPVLLRLILTVLEPCYRRCPVAYDAEILLIGERFIALYLRVA